MITREHDARDAAAAGEICRRAVEEGVVRTLGGTDMAVVAETICVHSDTPNAIEVARAVFDELTRSNALTQN